jgi:ribose transport system permease protein
MAQVGIMSVGMTFVIITAEIDLSIASIYALTGVATGSLMQFGWPLALAIVIGLGVGATAGLINGLATVLLKLPSFIVTLGTLSVFEGVALLLVGGNPVTLSSSTHGERALNALTQPTLGGLIPAQFIVFVVILVVGGALLRYSLFGYHVYATGGSLSAARLCGINTNRVKTVAFILSGLSAAVAGIIGLGFLDYVEGDSEQGIELTVIAAVIIGGTALFGGSGTMIGTLVGVLFLNVLQDILNLNAVSSFIETVITGAIIVVAVALDTVGILHERRAKLTG